MPTTIGDVLDLCGLGNLNPCLADGVAAMPLSSKCGLACLEAIVAVKRVMNQLDPHPSVQLRLRMALRVHLGILVNG